MSPTEKVTEGFTLFFAVKKSKKFQSFIFYFLFVSFKNKKYCKNISEEINNTQLVVIDSFDEDTMEDLVEDTAKLIVAEEQNASLKEPEVVFDSTVSEYRKEQKTPLFDTGNYFGRRRILSSMCLLLAGRILVEKFNHSTECDN